MNQRPTYPTVPVTCPACRTRFAAPVVSLIDVGQNPEAKFLLLNGQINVAVCPNCGTGGLLNVPLAYHDPEKELFLTYIPAEMGLPEAEQQRIIGEMTNEVMAHLPPEQRKGYLLQPRNFFRLETMIEAILQADGITPEMLAAQQAKVDLLNRLMQTADAEARRAIAQEHDEQIDYEFFQLLAANIEIAQERGQRQAAQQLANLRQELLEWTTTGREAAAREEALRELGERVSREELLDKLIAAARAGESIKIETMVTVARPIVDYLFYQQLADRIEAAAAAGDQGEADMLQSLRQTILDLTTRLDAEMQQEAGRREQLIRRILASDDIERAVRANLLAIDELFLHVLAGDIQAAEQAGRQEEAGRLQQIGDALFKIIQESQPQEVQLINRLLEADYPAGSRSLLEENRTQVDGNLLALMDLIIENLRRDGQDDLARKLAQVREQAAGMVQSNSPVLR